VQSGNRYLWFSDLPVCESTCTCVLTCETGDRFDIGPVLQVLKYAQAAAVFNNPGWNNLVWSNPNVHWRKLLKILSKFREHFQTLIIHLLTVIFLSAASFSMPDLSLSRSKNSPRKISGQRSSDMPNLSECWIFLYARGFFSPLSVHDRESSLYSLFKSHNILVKLSSISISSPFHPFKSQPWINRRD
jgi:hypothetical protein